MAGGHLDGRGTGAGSGGPRSTLAAMPRDPSPTPSSPPDLVERGPVETLAPSRTALVLVGVVGVTLAILAGLGIMNVSGSNLGDGEERLEPGTHVFTVGPVTLEATLEVPVIRRERCPRWTQLTDAEDDSTTAHLLWLDAVPLPSTAADVVLVEPPPDIVAWWRDELDLRVTGLPGAELDGRMVARYELGATASSRRKDGLVACGELDGVAATGLLGPAASFRQEVAVIDVEGIPLVLVAAAWSSGDLDRARDLVDSLVRTGRLVVPAAG